MRFSLPGITFIAATILICSCSPEKENTNREIDMPDTIDLKVAEILYDTVQRNLLDSFVFQISTEGIWKRVPKKISFPIDNPTDTLEYWITGDGTAQIMAKIRAIDKMAWPTFYIRNNELFLVRFRYWSKTPPMYSRETMLYYRDNKVVYCKERSLQMSATDLPYLLRRVEFDSCSRSLEVMENEYLKYWTAVKPFADSILNNPN